MIIFSENNLSSMEINFIEKEIISYPSLELECKVNNEGYNAISNYWIEKKSLFEFIHLVNEINNNRKGEAILLSMSPDNFILRLENYDDFGHFRVKYKMTKLTYSPDLQKIVMEGCFIIDSGNINNILQDFEKLYYNNFEENAH